MTRRLQMKALLLIGGASMGSVTAVPAQTPTVIHVCYLEKTGVLYRIDPSGTLPGSLLQTCAKPDKHFQLMWTDGLGADHGSLTGLADDDHPDYVREGATAGGDLGGTYPAPSVVKLNGNAVGSATPSTGDVLMWSGSSWDAVPAASGSVTDHGALTGLGDDDHAQYVLVDGVRSSTNGFVVTGTRGAGEIPTSGAGVRMMWYPGKAAFRAGETEGAEWNDGNVGEHSVALGLNTTASGIRSTALGVNTTASGRASTASGAATTASGVGSTALGSNTTASADFTTALGVNTTASGFASTAMGVNASTNAQPGSFVYGDNSTTSTINAPAANSFVVRAAGGTIFYSDRSLTSGTFLASGAGAWASVSDRDKKESFRDEDGEVVLAKIADLPIQSWSYRSQDSSIRHLGPTAQDFYAAFELGESDTTITTTDIDGVAMLAIQALVRRTRDLHERLETKEQAIADLRAEIDAALERLERLERARLGR